eukprot:512550-Hanusia_phi.AAC.1
MAIKTPRGQQRKSRRLRKQTPLLNLLAPSQSRPRSSTCWLPHICGCQMQDLNADIERRENLWDSLVDQGGEEYANLKVSCTVRLQTISLT